MNEWDRVEASLMADDSVAPGTKIQIWRSTALARTWLDANGIDASDASDGDITRFIREVAPTSGPKGVYHRKWAMKALIHAAAEASPPRRGRSGTACARLDEIGVKSPLGKAVAQVLASARSEGDRRRFATCLGTFIQWCDVRGVAPAECWPGDLAVYRRDRLTTGYRSPGEYLRVARRLVDELARGRSPSALASP